MTRITIPEKISHLRTGCYGLYGIFVDLSRFIKMNFFAFQLKWKMHETADRMILSPFGWNYFLYLFQLSLMKFWAKVKFVAQIIKLILTQIHSTYFFRNFIEVYLRAKNNLSHLSFDEYIFSDISLMYSSRVHEPWPWFRWENIWLITLKIFLGFQISWHPLNFSIKSCYSLLQT